MATPKHPNERGEEVPTYTLLLDTSEDTVDTKTVDWLLEKSGPGHRLLVFISDRADEDPLVRFSDLVDRCHAAGVEIMVRTSEEQERYEAEQVLSINRQHLASPASDATIDAALQDGVHRAPTLSGTDALTDRFVQPQDLPVGPAPSAPPAGPMATHLGEQISAEQLTNEDMLISEQLAARIRAWPVRPLIGTVFVAEDSKDLGRALQTHVQQQLGVPVRVSGEFQQLGKYMHVHSSATTPPDPSTGQPMFLELYGHIAVVGDHDLRTLEGARWLRQYRRDNLQRQRVAPLVGQLVVRLEAATWSNVSYPGFDVPFYM